MPIYQLKLIKKETIANNTVQLVFEKPEGFKFKSGQYGGFTLINPIEKDPAGLTRRFSLASMPDDRELFIVTRVQNSSYKRSLLALNPGDEIKFAGPTGIFTLHDDIMTPAVFIAGGIGIAPFWSMIRHNLATSSKQEMLLFYGNQKLEDAAFLEDCLALEKKHDTFKCIPSLANPTETWKGEEGYITYTMLKKYIKDINQPIYYVCGSPAMVTALQELLLEMGIDEAKIKVEDFPGY